ncbi:cadherin-like domain-containing protein [Christiangramia crocea]|uniref:Ig-like domain-containing protein n=1 Tax=Christiangramia crocea TaxID=2904124 RepID=A0A9X1UWW3_9FLAO|nr:cadherin-like domain-containing protein [Gramella crocea]MCG9970984.1 Ig-like domain-containing protein [Gramella crocea]
MSVIVNESGEIVQVVVKEIYGSDGQDYQVADFANFTGELDVSGDFQPYNDYTGAEITSLTLSTAKKRGATGNVRVKGGSIATNALTNLGTVLPAGATISTDVNQWNEIDYQYLSDTHIRIILTVLDSNFQPVYANQPAPSNTAPVTSADSYSVDENQVLNVAAPGVLANDTDADADSLTAILVSDVTNGVLTLNADGSFTYTPNTDYFGSDSFTYKSNDGTVDGNTVTVSITVNEVTAGNTAPTDITLSANSVDEDAANDTVIGTFTTTDTEGGAMTYSIVTQQVAGAFKVVGDQLQVADTNQIVYANNTTLTVTIRTTDSGGLTFDEQFTITVNEAAAADTTAPTFIATYPQTANVAETSFDVQVQLDEPGTAYVVVVADGAAAPTSAEVKAGTGSGGTGQLFAGNVAVAAASTTYTVTVNSGVSGSTPYDVYIVAEDDEGTPNLQASPTKVDVTTTAASAYEAKTTAFMNAVGIPDDANASIYPSKTNTQVWQEVDTFVSTLKTAGLLTKSFKIYLKIGSNATQQAIDLITPASSGIFGGTWTHNNKGAVGNGTNTYFNSGFNFFANAVSGKNDVGVTAVANAVSATSDTDFSALIGVDENNAGNYMVQLFVKWFGSIDKVTARFTKEIISNSAITSKGIHTMQRINDTSKYYKDGTLNTTGGLDAAGAFPNYNAYEGAQNRLGTSTINFLNGTIGTTVYHKNLSDSEVTTLVNAINTLETNLSRNI